MKFTKKQQENISKTFLDIFKLLVVGIIITDFALKAPIVLKFSAVMLAIMLFIIAIAIDQ